MYRTEADRFEKKLALHTAPTLLGIKCASLISLKTGEFQLDSHAALFNQKAGVKGLKSRILCECKNRTLLLVYHEKLLAARLADETAKSMLSVCGYAPDGTISEHLSHLASRILSASEFPHEIGIFLGYPLEDVRGFIQNKGENFKLCGSWKVYGCEEQAKRTFINYSKCRTFLCNRLNEGADIYQALKIS